MKERCDAVDKQITPDDPKRGILMFKDHVASMRSGPRLLGGERDDAGKDLGHSLKSE